MPTTKTIWVNGCFDILHRGHIELFRYARSLGDRLIVGIDSDVRVKKHKGSLRPVNTQMDRKFFLEALRDVNVVAVFNDDAELVDLIKLFSVDTMVVGSDWKDKKVIGSENVKQILFFDRIVGYSTTKILERT